MQLKVILISKEPPHDVVDEYIYITTSSYSSAKSKTLDDIHERIKTEDGNENVYIQLEEIL